ncbi:ABC transporter permease [Aurantiacibacter gangjinensis]|uniref:ABC transporter permease n=1 Tax=Aurantiacibacter gangjinensis TaxID=502682 RepID=A0A0G9ML91_9SPHN|nr:ABC transporter permease [Aurantiacibacter gangjinensis]APE27373.1 Methionine ABC transporter ATP-binding protein [Aurantiacibacter gangjinensis]KLE31457.1 ABC transporter permease [Aurantiacibacter gangjinensis]
MSIKDGGRLSLWKAAAVVARRDFTAILFSKAFIFFLLGPLFPVAVMALAGGVGAQVQSEARVANVGIAMESADVDAMLAARERVHTVVGDAVPTMVEAARIIPGDAYDPADVLENQEGNLAALVTGTPEEPTLTATDGRLVRWQGVVGMVAAEAANPGAQTYPEVQTQAVGTSGASQNTARLQTAQGGQLLLFLLIMLLASMVLSNLVEEKGNKIIEILAAAIPMDAVFLGKLFAMLGISVVGVAVWGSVGFTVLRAGGVSLSDYANPGVGWPAFFALFALYFGMGYLLLGSIFLAVGSLANTVREVQTVSMPATMFQILVFFFASLAVTARGGWIEYTAMAFPLSSPFAMVARAATDEAIWPHLLALAWQAVWVAIFIRLGASLFRRRVMKSGPQGARKGSLIGRAFAGMFRTGSRTTP